MTMSDKIENAPAGSWQCHACTFTNCNERGLMCIMCQTVRPQSCKRSGRNGNDGAVMATTSKAADDDGASHRARTSDGAGSNGLISDAPAPPLTTTSMVTRGNDSFRFPYAKSFHDEAVNEDPFANRAQKARDGLGSSTTMKDSLTSGTSMPPLTTKPMAKRSNDSFQIQSSDPFRNESVNEDPSANHVQKPLDGLGSSTMTEDTNERENPTSKKSLEHPHGAQWDAFASLENNYQSSDDDDEDDESDEEDSGNGWRRKEGADEDNNDQWDAFKSLEQNYESSEDDGSCDSDDNSSSDEDEMSEYGMKRNGDNGDNPTLHKQQNENEKKSSKLDDANVGYIDLVDSDDEGSASELDIKMPGKENNKIDKPQRSSNSRLKKKQQSKHSEPYTIDGESDSSLSEVESRRPLPSPSARALPPWQLLQRRKSTNSTAPIPRTNNLRSSDSFLCMNVRNDIGGGSGAGVNGFRLAQRKGDDKDELDDKTTGTKKRKGRQSTASAASATSAKKKGSTTTKRKRSTSSKASSSKAKTAKAAPKKRRRRSYKRKSNGRSSNNRRSSSTASRGRGNSSGSARGRSPWDAREKGYRNPIGAPYMAIAKQEPMLRNVGGASIQF
mmetsp:Transcript_19032/g.40148  ORF Transcript_19032/g.40148 Transcript_19032/m.40148 type:complete len:613 (+) Transcript_19032:108-1946(+)